MLPQPHTAHPGPLGTGVGGVARIVGPYPPPPPPARTPVGAADVEPLLGRPPAVTRYGPAAHRVPRAARPRAGRVWAAASLALAAAGVGAVVLLPTHSSSSARLDVPLAVAAAPAGTAPIAPGAPVATAARTAGLRQLPASVPVRVQIPALGMTSAIMDLGLTRTGAMEVPPGARPVGWYDRSPTPGQQGPAVLAGHVDWDGERGAFYGLRAGDAVVIDRADGTVATFVVDRVEEHHKDDFPTQEVYGDIEHAGLRLITCGGTFDKKTGNYEDNVIVFASLTATS